MSVRDRVTGQYAFDDDFERLCRCGHTLGVHVEGGFDCDADAIGNKEPHARGCQCTKFRPTGKRATRDANGFVTLIADQREVKS